MRKLFDSKAVMTGAGAGAGYLAQRVITPQLGKIGAISNVASLAGKISVVMVGSLMAAGGRGATRQIGLGMAVYGAVDAGLDIAKRAEQQFPAAFGQAV